jgi:NADPH-dependent ferric siderophore reductase
MSVLTSLIERAFLRKAEVLALKVESVSDIWPHMKRIRFTGKDLGRFETNENIHARLVFPPSGYSRNDWRKRDSGGRLDVSGVRSHYRKYTIRQVDAARGVLDIDFLVHDASGPGSDFARQARPGDLIGIIGPGGRSIGPADWYLIAGDDAALPAIARIAEMLPASASGSVLIEVDDGADELELKLPSRMSLTWLHRAGRRAGSTSLLRDAVVRTQWPEKSIAVFAWIAAEAETARQIRLHLKADRKLDKAHQLVVPYWKTDADDRCC